MSVGRVAVVVPTLGERLQYLRACLASIRDQEGVRVEVYVVAPPGRVPSELLTPDTTLVPDPGGGLSAALNAGLRAINEDCDFFAWLGDDDLLRPGALSTAKNALESDPTRTLVYGRCEYIDENGKIIFVNGAGNWARRIVAWGPNLIPQPGSMMRSRSVVHVGGFDERLRLAMDLDLFLRLRQVGSLAFVPHTLAAFRWHSDSLTVGSERDSFNESDAVRRRYAPRWLRPAWPLLRIASAAALALAKRVVKSI